MGGAGKAAYTTKIQNDPALNSKAGSSSEELSGVSNQLLVALCRRSRIDKVELDGFAPPETPSSVKLPLPRLSLRIGGSMGSGHTMNPDELFVVSGDDEGDCALGSRFRKTMLRRFQEFLVYPRRENITPYVDINIIVLVMFRQVFYLRNPLGKTAQPTARFLGSGEPPERRAGCPRQE